MAQVSRTTLKGYFETGDEPTEAQFIDLIDSCLNIADDGTGSSYTFENGIVEAAGIVKLGGSLTGNTTISTTSAYSLTLEGFGIIPGTQPYIKVDGAGGYIDIRQGFGDVRMSVGSDSGSDIDRILGLKSTSSNKLYAKERSKFFVGPAFASTIESPTVTEDGYIVYWNNTNGWYSLKPEPVLTILDDSVTNAKAANMAVNTIKGRATAGTGDPEDLTATQVRTIINVEDGATAYSQGTGSLADGASVAWDCNSKKDNRYFLSTAQSTIALTLSNVADYSVNNLMIKKTIAGDCAITLGGAGLAFRGPDDADYATSSVITLTGAANDRFELSLANYGPDDVESTNKCLTVSKLDKIN